MTEMEIHTRRAAPASLTHSSLQLQRGTDRAAVPRRHVQIHVREEISSLPTAAKAPALLRKAKYYRHQRSFQGHSQRATTLKTPCKTQPAPSPH